jgi:outer membrane protein OmpA-like peptidoglycan-associated protein
MLRLALLLITVLLSGCGPKTTLVLLPDEDGSLGKVVMQTEGGQVQIEEAYGFTEVRSGSAPSTAAVMSPAVFKKRWGKLAQLEPRSPQLFTLNFLSGGTELTEEAVDTLPLVITAMLQPHPVEVNIIGHTDTVGNEEYNYRLSLERAQVVYDLLKERAPWVTRITVESFGQNDPLIPTADNVAEPRNRRVEILVR